MNSDVSLFSTLSKYTASENVTPEENFSTEILVYLLNYSLGKRTDLFQRFMHRLDEKVQLSDYSDYRISTQQYYRVGKLIMIPDITIETEQKIFFIEVKVESSLNSYIADENKDVRANESKEYINQLEQYQKISTQKARAIFLLTKY